jgi:alkanesulfonate monooxygenase SsuD/methylene tetrahydromethanopterin reductase-like flavin-dependent oxidoreductase (luciferase family)
VSSEGAGPRVGLLLPTRQGDAFDGSSAEGTLSLAQRAEELGFDSLWAGESLLARPRYEPITLLGAVAERTKTIRLGTGVMLPALHPPILLAQRLATLDCIAKGRLIVGAGIGIDTPATRKEFEAAGVPFEQRVGRLVETVRACRSLWSSREADASDVAPGRKTRYWDLGDALVYPRPHREGGPPVWLGATFALEPALRRVGRFFDGWLPTSPAAEAYAAGWRRVQAAAQEADRNEDALTPAVYLTVSLDRDPDVAHELLDEYVTSYYGIPADAMRKVQGMFAGTPEDCARWILGFVRAGASHLVLRCPDLEGQLDAIAREVLPGLRAG